MNSKHTAVVKRDGEWWIGWLEEIPVVNGQGRTREELFESLRSALNRAFVGERPVHRTCRTVADDPSTGLGTNSPQRA